MNINGKYERVIEIFKELSKIPRNSRKEEKIAKYVEDYARRLNLECYRDSLNNVIVKKNADENMKDKKGIIFQAHTDMVCEKRIDSNHDFEIDPIDVIEENGVLVAKDTTLGADDGIGVATLLFLMEEKEIKLPRSYFIFTTQEEIGMYGAKALDLKDVDASYLVNLDGEEENTAIVGCAGGVSVHYEKKCETEVVQDVYKLCIYGLHGGHSGVDINKGRINANYLAARILNELANVKIVSFEGGNKDNAIANTATICFSTSTENVRETINSVKTKFKYQIEDRNEVLDLEKIEGEHVALTKSESKAFCKLIINLKQNVIKMSEDIDGLVETSGNIGIVRVNDGRVHIVESLRSSIDKDKEAVKSANNELAQSFGYEFYDEGEYPGWKYNPDSNLEKVYIQSYKETHNNEMPIVCAIHAGVECGMIFEKKPNLDMISIGPDVVDVHTVNEKLYLKSCRKLLETLLILIEKLD